MYIHISIKTTISTFFRRRAKSIDVASGRKIGEDPKLYKKEKEQSLRSKISSVLKGSTLGRSLSMDRKQAPALPPKGVVPDVIPSRPTAEVSFLEFISLICKFDFHANVGL